MATIFIIGIRTLTIQCMHTVCILYMRKLLDGQIDYAVPIWSQNPQIVKIKLNNSLSNKWPFSVVPGVVRRPKSESEVGCLIQHSLLLLKIKLKTAGQPPIDMYIKWKLSSSWATLLLKPSAQNVLLRHRIKVKLKSYTKCIKNV